MEACIAELCLQHEEVAFNEGIEPIREIIISDIKTIERAEKIKSVIQQHYQECFNKNKIPVLRIGQDLHIIRNDIVTVTEDDGGLSVYFNCGYYEEDDNKDDIMSEFTYATKVFISGSRSIREINSDVKTRINNMISKNLFILIGDAKGVDDAVQRHLWFNDYKRVAVYVKNETIRTLYDREWIVKNIEVPNNLSPRKGYMFRDFQMAKDCHYGMSIWDGKSLGTKTNINNLEGMGKHNLVFDMSTGTTYQV